MKKQPVALTQRVAALSEAPFIQEHPVIASASIPKEATGVAETLT